MAQLPEHRAPHLTRRGSLAYYLAAWVCGGFFFSVAIFLFAPKYSDLGLTMDMHSFLSVCFFVLFYGWVATLLFAFLLRAAARALRWKKTWSWVLGGATLTILFGIGLSLLPGVWITKSEWLQFLKELFELSGEIGLPLRLGWGLQALATVLAGAATSYILYRIHRAFEPAEESSSS